MLAPSALLVRVSSRLRDLHLVVLTEPTSSQSALPGTTSRDTFSCSIDECSRSQTRRACSQMLRGQKEWQQEQQEQEQEEGQGCHLGQGQKKKEKNERGQESRQRTGPTLAC